MDYIVKIEDDHWRCSLFSYMYLCGNLRRRELTLCCVPSPIYKIIRFFTRDRQFCNGTCSYCGAALIILALTFPFVPVPVLWKPSPMISIRTAIVIGH